MIPRLDILDLNFNNANPTDEDDKQLPDFLNLNFNNAPVADAEEVPAEVNREDIAQYLKTVFDYCDGLVHVRIIQDKLYEGHKTEVLFQEWYQNDDTLLDKLYQNAVTANQHKAAVYVQPTLPYDRSNKEDGVEETGVIIADFDDCDIAEGLAKAEQYLGTASLLVASGGVNKMGQAKCHAYWKLSESAGSDEIAKVKQARTVLAEATGADPSFKRITQIIRLPGSVHWKGDEPKAVRVIKNTGLEYDLDEISDQINNMPGAISVSGPRDMFDLNFNSAAPEGVTAEELAYQKVSAGGVDGITRFDAFSKFAGALVRDTHYHNKDVELARQQAVWYAREQLTPPWDEMRAIQEFNALWKKHCKENGSPGSGNKEAQQKRQEEVIASAIAAENRPLLRPGGTFRHIPDEELPEELFYNGVLRAGGGLVVGAGPKTGKSTFAQELIEHAAMGEPFLDYFVPSRPLNTLYLQFELDEGDMKEREKHKTYSEDQWSRIGKHLIISRKIFFQMDADSVEQNALNLKAMLGDWVPDIIVLDPIASCWGVKNEIDNQDILDFLTKRLELLRATVNSKAAMILIHHSNKSWNPTKDGDPFTALRGGNALQGWYNTGIILWRDAKLKDSPTSLFIQTRSMSDIPNMKIAFDKSTYSFYRIEDEEGGDGPDDGGDSKPEDNSFDIALVNTLKRDSGNGVTHTLESLSEALVINDNSGIPLGAKARKSKLNRELQKLVKSGIIKYVQTSPEVAKYRPADKMPGNRAKLLVVKGMEYGGKPVQATHRHDAEKGRVVKDLSPFEWPNYSRYESAPSLCLGKTNYTPIQAPGDVAHNAVVSAVSDFLVEESKNKRWYSLEDIANNKYEDFGFQSPVPVVDIVEDALASHALHLWDGSQIGHDAPKQSKGWLWVEGMVFGSERTTETSPIDDREIVKAITITPTHWIDDGELRPMPKHIADQFII